MPLMLLVLGLGGCGPTLQRYDAPPPGAERRVIRNADGVAVLSYLRAGPPEARRLIFVHGTPGDATNYLDFLARPPAGWQVLSVDRPGFGQSRPGAGDDTLTFAGQAAALLALLGEAAGEKPVLVGHSLGGPIVLRAAADHPEKVGGVVVLAGSVDPALERPRWYNHLGALPPVSFFLSRGLSRSNREIFAAPEQTRRLAGVLDQVVCPVAVVQGGKDTLVPPANAAFLLENLPHARRVELWLLPEAGHFLPWENADTVRRAIDWASR